MDPTSKAQIYLWVEYDPYPKPKAKRENQQSQVVTLETPVEAPSREAHPSLSRKSQLFKNKRSFYCVSTKTRVRVAFG